MSFEQAVVQLEQTNSKLQEEVVRFRDAAMGLNNIYSTITEGRQNTADGKYFSVPGNGAYMRLYRRQGSSAELIAEFPDRAELNSVIDQLGPLLGRGVVGPSSSADLLAQGAFGLGGWGKPLTDFNAAPTQNEFWQGWGQSATDAPGNSNYRPGLDLYRVSSGRGTRLMFSTGTAIVRQWNQGEVDETFTLYSDKNILGSVSESGGVPTGAIIERGSNANGEYVKLAGGLVIMTRSVTFDMAEAANILYDYPLSVKGVPTGSGSPAIYGSTDINNWGEGHGNIYCREFAWNIRMGIPKTGIIPVQLFGLGFWHN